MTDYKTPEEIGDCMATFAIDYALWEIYEDITVDVKRLLGDTPSQEEKDKFVKRILDEMSKKIEDYFFKNRGEEPSEGKADDE